VNLGAGRQLVPLPASPTLLLAPDPAVVVGPSGVVLSPDSVAIVELPDP
jgi:hypothetical protein